MSYATLARGEFAGGRFTRVANAALRDVRLSYKARGLLAHIASHSEGWGVTEQQFATKSPEGVTSIRSGLRELEASGYLRRYRVRDELGCLGAAHWVITDDPTSLDSRVAELARSLEGNDLVPSKTRRSEPECGFPKVDDPPQENRTPKKTNHKKTRTQEEGQGEEGARARAKQSPAQSLNTATDDGAGQGWGIEAGERPEPTRGTLFARTVIEGIAVETGLGLSPKQHRRLVVEHLPAALGAVRELGDEAISGSELVEWLRSEHESTMSLYAVLSTRCRPDYLSQALPVWVARNRTPGGLPGPVPRVPRVPGPRREQDPMTGPDPFSRAGAPPTCVLHTGVALVADATGRRSRCHRCENPTPPPPERRPQAASAAPGQEPPSPPTGDLMDTLDEALSDTEPAPPEHCGNRSCHQQRRHVIVFDPTTKTHQDLGPCPRCHPDHARAIAA